MSATEGDAARLLSYDVEETEQVGPEGQRRKPRVRLRTLSMKSMQRGLALGRLLSPANDDERPRTVADCERLGLGTPANPCAYLGCRYSLLGGVNERGSMTITAPYTIDPIDGLPQFDWDRITETCVLRVAERGGETLEEVGVLLGVVRERARQIETQGLARCRRAPEAEKWEASEGATGFDASLPNIGHIGLDRGYVAAAYRARLRGRR
jgi:hypothetical protein